MIFNAKNSVCVCDKYSCRFGAEGFLTVSGDSGRSETFRVNGSSNNEDNKLKLTNQSVIYVGGLPADLKVLLNRETAEQKEAFLFSLPVKVIISDN